MREVVRLYCNVIAEGHEDDEEEVDFNDERLVALRERMTHADVLQIKEWAADVAQIMEREAEALEKYARAKFGPRLSVIEGK